MKQVLFSSLVALGICILFVGGWIFYSQYRAVAPVLLPPDGDIVQIIEDQNEVLPGQDDTDFALDVPDGFSIEIFAKNIPGARVMVVDARGNMWVSQMKEGVVSLLTTNDEGIVTRVDPIFTGLNNPHGLAIDPNDPFVLYIAEEHRISKVRVYSDQPLFETLVELPTGGRHVSRTIGFGPDGLLYVSIGSSCDVCLEDDPFLGSIAVVDPRTGGMQMYATGLRNSVFFTWHEVDGSMWATEMGRDRLGDDLPPDEINIIQPRKLDSNDLPKNYGWPICYGNKVHDTLFDSNQYVRDPCEDTVAPVVELQAHVAPLGIDVIPESTAWPEEYWGDLIIAEHGSWNRSEPVGYKLSLVRLNDRLEFLEVQDFITGWLTDEGRALGRPVDVLVRHDGTMYVSDDKAGLIYKISYMNQQPPQEPMTSPEEHVRLPVPMHEFLQIDASETQITFTGDAVGTMFFEASFPVRIEDDNGMLIAQGLATATDEWMTEDFVPFTASLTKVADPATAMGKVFFQRDNPSGLPEHDLTIGYTVEFVE